MILAPETDGNSHLSLAPTRLLPLCMAQMHHEARHPKVIWEAEKYPDLHAVHGGTTKGVAVRGSNKK